jgi:alkanesulfonate monooxygenase SsuD/methylene tetrahydromethanopterin reductase-like flavin-dependent oxidoreductase (luciferase family)
MTRFCVMIEGPEGVTWDEWRLLAATSERLGFDALFTSDHYLSSVGADRDGLDAWAVVSALAAITTRIRLGTLVSPVTFRLPAVVAKLAASADHVSGGRVEVGLGAGWYEREHTAFGFPFPPLATRLAMLEEQARVVRSLLDGEVVDHAGDHYQLHAARLVPRPLQSRLPLILGGLGRRRAAALAALVADEYNLTDTSPAACHAARGRLDAACEAHGRDPRTLTMSLMAPCVVGTSDAEIRDRLERACRRIDEDPAQAAAESSTWIVGSPDRVCEQIAAYRSAGVERFMLQHLDHTDLDMLELFARDVAPNA